jgi:hypothetical protein
VITPLHTKQHKLRDIRKSLALATARIQLIIVLNNPELTGHIHPKTSDEEVVVCSRRGRGYAFLEGILKSKGSIALLLHSDTLLPAGWDTAILTALKDKRVVGGGFSLSYENSSPSLKIVSWLSNLWVWLSGELYGDRAIFIRSEILRQCLPVLPVPIFEDLRLKQCMEHKGRLVLLGNKVKTSAEKYRKYGLLGYILRIWLARLWYALGIDTRKIYAAYYYG